MALIAQPVATFEMSLATPPITELERVPGSKQFYACSPVSVADTVLPIILKFDSAGNILQQLQYSLPRMQKIIRTKAKSDGGLLLLGGPVSPLEDTMYCVSLSPAGTIEWYKALYLEEDDISSADIIQVSDGGIVISGSVFSVRTAFLLKLDAHDNTEWMKSFSAGTNGIARGAGIIEKNGSIIFCSIVQEEDAVQAYNLRLSLVSIATGDLESVQDIVSEEIGFGGLKIYDDLHGGFYLLAFTEMYRAPCQTTYVLHLDSSLQVLNNYTIPTAEIYNAFGVTGDGTVNAGTICTGYANIRIPSTLTKVGADGRAIYSGHYPGKISPPYFQDTVVIVYRIVSLGKQVFIAGRKSGTGFISALNSTDLGANNCSLIENPVELYSAPFHIVDTSWFAVKNEPIVSTDLPAVANGLSLTPELTTCAESNELYVDQHAGGSNDGSSWKNAFTSLSAALDKMNAIPIIKKIYVAEGVYASSPGGEFFINKFNALVLGGYPTGGGERNIDLHQVILKGPIHVGQSVQFDGFKIE